MSTTTTFDLSEYKRAIEERDGAALLAAYSGDAEVKLVDRVSQPGAPRVLRGSEEIGAWIDDVCARDMEHHVEHSVQDDGGVAFTEACRYADGTNVPLRDGPADRRRPHRRSGRRPGLGGVARGRTPERDGGPVYYAKWRHEGRQIKRRIGCAWIVRGDAAPGDRRYSHHPGWIKRRGRPADDYLTADMALANVPAVSQRGKRSARSSRSSAWCPSPSMKPPRRGWIMPARFEASSHRRWPTTPQRSVNPTTSPSDADTSPSRGSWRPSAVVPSTRSRAPTYRGG